MTLEELSVVFTADIQPFARAVQQVQGLVHDAAQAADGMAAAFHQAGLNAAAGLRNGLAAGKSGVMQAAESVAQAAAQALRSALQIHSPSRVTQNMGRMFDEGFLQGILDDMPRLETQARQLGERTENALKTPVSASSPGADMATPLQVTVPLEIDGYRLGMAVIENLNRITNATGRVELKM